MREKSEQLAKSIQERDKAMKSFMDDLQDYSDKPCDNADDVVFKEGIKAFLDLIEDKTNDTNATESLPSIDTPFKLGSKKDKYLEGLTQDTDYKKQFNKKIGKVDTSGLLKSKPTEKKSEDVDVCTDKATLIKKMFESSKGLSRAMSEQSLKPKVKRTKTLIDPKESMIMAQLPMLQRRPSIKKQISIPSHYSERPKYEPKSNDITPSVAKSQWDDFLDPEERKKAILAKHGFKPYEQKEHKHDDPLNGLDIIPDHIMKDEILYKKYIKENWVEEDSSRESSPERFKKDPKEGSFSSLMNILSALKKGTMQKNALESRSMLDKKAQEAMKISTSAQDLTQIPGSCQNIRQHFENYEESSDEDEPIRRGPVMRSSSCATLGSMWANHVKNKTSEAAPYDRSTIKSGLVSNLKTHLTNTDEAPTALNDPVFRKSLSHLELEDNNQPSYKSNVRVELDALRESGQTSSIFKLERGNRSTLRKAHSNIDMGKSKDNLFDEMEEDELEEMRQNKANIKAMFEAAAPKYRYGGSNECLVKEEEPKRGTSIPSSLKDLYKILLMK